MKELVNAEPYSVLHPTKRWTRGDAEAEIQRVIKETPSTLGPMIGRLDEARRAIERIGETSGHDDVARDAIAELEGSLRALVPPEPSEWIEKICSHCGYACGVRRDAVALDVHAYDARTGVRKCPVCRALAAEARLVPGHGDAWWTETMQKGEHVAEQLAREGHGDWTCLPFSHDHVEGDTLTPVLSRSQVLFRGEYLVVDPDSADGLLLDLKIGNRYQTINGEPIPLSVFNPKNWGSLDAMREAAHLKLDIANVAEDVSLVVLLNKPGPFRATLWGRSERNTGGAVLTGNVVGGPPSALSDYLARIHGAQ